MALYLRQTDTLATAVVDVGLTKAFRSDRIGCTYTLKIATGNPLPFEVYGINESSVVPTAK